MHKSLKILTIDNLLLIFSMDSIISKKNKKRLQVFAKCFAEYDRKVKHLTSTVKVKHLTSTLKVKHLISTVKVKHLTSTVNVKQFSFQISHQNQIV